MKRFFSLCLLFAIVPFIWLASIELRIRNIPNSYKYKYNWMQANAADVETIILGSSHTLRGIRHPDSLGCGLAFSLANSSQRVREDYMLLKKWAPRYKNLKTVIMPVSYFSMTQLRFEEQESHRHLCRNYGISMHLYIYPFAPEFYFEISNVKSAKLKLKQRTANMEKLEVYEYGGGAINNLADKKDENWTKEAFARTVARHTHEDLSHVADNYSYFCKIAEFCRERGIRLVLITTPCWSGYRDLLNKTQLQTMYDCIHRLQDKFGVEYFDYLADPRFVPDDYWDCDHLSDVGSTKFTQILSEDLRKCEK